jgi:2,3-bisphosphoglycerate-independent phosphoglycerate mutase
VISIDLIRELATSTPSKIVLLVMDGVGGLPDAQTGLTELETALSPNLDRLAADGITGLVEPVGPGITPGSGPGHLALFGYDPIANMVGRGALSALGVGFKLERDDVAARINFATVDDEGRVTDRRAGRISTALNRQLVAELRQVRLPGIETFLETEAGHRAVVVFRAPGLDDRLTDTDPQAVGVPPHPVRATGDAAQKTADIANAWIAEAGSVLKDKHPANCVLLRGFAKHPDLPTLPEIYKLNPAAIAAYPMYRGLGQLAGMKVLPTGTTFADEVQTLREHWDEHDFFFVHYKYTDSTGEDGNFPAKVAAVEEVDRVLPEILDLKPDVIAVAGDHSTPSRLKAHSWHPVPFMLGSEWVISDDVERFTERACARGQLGRFPSQEIMLHLMAHALKLQKYGA